MIVSMNEFESLLARNKQAAEQDAAESQSHPSLPDALPQVKALILGCADMRVDPAHIFGLKPGEAVVLRNIGGRVTPGLLSQLGMLGQIGQVAGKVPGGGGEFHLIVLHHTDCGITRLSGEPGLLMQYFQVKEAELREKEVQDPRAAVAADFAALRALKQLPGTWLLSGLVYNVSTSLVEVVVPPQPIAP
jgi:carbonic anhydrase